ncbi:MAG: hypothetical protein GWP10_22445 [Nitrospiraceae bacterium]|nr:hypothetical protein [Nitrospiraceae bacterium]
MLGLFFVDNEGDGWISEMEKILCSKECNGKPITYFWWHQRPIGTDETLTCLRKDLKELGFFPIFAKTKDKCYMFTVVDFIVDPLEKLDEIQSEWGRKYCLYEWGLPQNELKKKVKKWTEEKQKEGKVGKSANPSILFATSCVTEMDCSKQVFHVKNIRANLIPIRL